MKPTNSLNQPIAQNRAATPKLAANCFSLLRLALPILAVLMLLGSQAKAGIFVHDGSTAVTYNGNVGAINQSVTVTAGADVLVVTVFNANTTAAVVEPSTLNWNGTTLNLAVSSDGLLQSLWRGVAIYYLYNPPVGTATITNIITTGGAPGIWVSAYTLSGVSKTSPPLIGSIANNSNPNTTINFTVLGVVSNSWAAVGMSQSGTGDSVNITTIGGSTSASTDNSDNSSTMTAGLVSGLSAGVDTFIATANGTGQRDCFVGAVFAPASQVGGQKDLWTGFSSSTWDTTSINWTNSFPTNIYANGDAVVFDNSASQFNINLPASVVPTTVTFSNTAAQSYTINGSGQIGGGAVTIGTGSVTLNNPNNFGGPVTIGNAGSLTLNNVNTYGGSTTIGTGGSLLVGNSGLLGNGNYGGNIVNNGSLTFANSSLQILSGVISGSGTFTNNASGEIILRGASSFTKQPGPHRQRFGQSANGRKNSHHQRRCNPFA
jgi:hypothetical protein